MGFIQEFKEFALKGNVVDLAVGVVIGGAFGKIIAALVDNVLMPPLGMMMGGVNFADLQIVLKQAQGETAAVAVKYGLFFQSVVDFVLIALAIFAGIKVMNSWKRAEELPAPDSVPGPSVEQKLLAEIRDLLKK